MQSRSPIGDHSFFLNQPSLEVQHSRHGEILSLHLIIPQAKEIKEAIISMLYPDNLLIDVKERDSVEKQVVELISKDKKLESESELIYSSGKYGKRKKKTVLLDPVNSEYIGTAGECAVISELLFSGYNANRMMIDDGVNEKNIFRSIPLSLYLATITYRICTGIY